MRVAVYGGSFNPPHVGHAMVAAWLRWTELADQVWLVPVAQHALAPDKPLAPFERRCDWASALAELVGDFVRVEPIEADLEPPSYTLRTLQALSARHPDVSLRWVLGADNLPHLDKWYRWPDIEAGYDPIVVGRAGYPSPPGAPMFPGVSSTEIRRRILAGDPVDALVPAAVRARIRPEDTEAWRVVR